jgi:uncharacterized phage protein (TIGR01671 family)
MRQYRGKASFSGKWYFGCYVRIGDRHFIVNPDGGYEKCNCGTEHFAGYVEVDPATVGQATGLRDKPGKEIWEGDEVKWHTCDGYVGRAVVEYKDGYFYPVGDKPLSWGTDFDKEWGFEIIGTIHDTEAENA